MAFLYFLATIPYASSHAGFAHAYEGIIQAKNDTDPAVLILRADNLYKDYFI